MFEKTISKKTVFEGRILNVDVLEVELENGQHSVREIVQHGVAVAIIPQLPGGALSALLRRNEFDGASRLKVFRELAGHFKELAEFPPEVTDDLSDEQYVRNVVCSVYCLDNKEP